MIIFMGLAPQLITEEIYKKAVSRLSNISQDNLLCCTKEN